MRSSITPITAWMLCWACFVVFHDPEGHNLAFNIDMIEMVRAGAPHHDHVTSKIGAILYVGSKGVGVLETQDEALRLIKQGCAQ